MIQSTISRRGNNHVQWNLAITNLLGAMRKVCYSEVFVKEVNFN